MTGAGQWFLLVQRGASRGWWAIYAGAWVVAVGLSRISVPRVGPDTSPQSQSLEQLGAVGLCLPAVTLGVLCVDRSRWLTAVSPRPRWELRLRALGNVVALGALGVAIASPAYPGGVSRIRVVALFAVVVSLSVCAARMLDTAWIGLPGPVLVAGSTVRGLVPWELNIVYNPSTDHLLLGVAAVAACAAVAVVVLPGRTPDR